MDKEGNQKTGASKNIPFWQWIIIVVAGITLFFAQSSYWVRHTVFDKQTFTSIATSTLQTDANRMALSKAITETVLKDRPALLNAIGDRVTPLISGMLASDIGVKVANGVIDKTYTYLLAPDRQDVAIHLESVKDVIVRLTQVAEDMGREPTISVDKIPDQIVLIQTEDFPSLNATYRTFLWLAPLLWLATIGLVIWFIALGRAQYSKRVYVTYGMIAIVGLLGLGMGPFVPPIIASLVTNITIQPVADSLVTAFLAPFVTQMSVMLGVATVAVLLFWQRTRIVHGVQMLVSKISPKHQSDKK